MMEFNDKIKDFSSAILCAGENSVLKKAVFSKPKDKGIVKTVLTLKSISGKVCLQAESFYTDNKARHENIALDENASEKLCQMIDSYLQVNLITTLGECEYKASKSGVVTLIGVKNLVNKIASSSNDNKVEISSNNQKKNYICKVYF